jgi:hypothetical protein
VLPEPADLAPEVVVLDVAGDELIDRQQKPIPDSDRVLALTIREHRDAVDLRPMDDGKARRRILLRVDLWWGRLQELAGAMAATGRPPDPVPKFPSLSQRTAVSRPNQAESARFVDIHARDAYLTAVARLVVVP